MEYWDLIAKAYDEVDIYSGPEPFFRAFTPLPKPVQHLLAAHWCQSEIGNGGFDQFFRNSTGVLAPEAEAGFRAIGLTEVADLVATAIGRFGSIYPRDEQQRTKAMESLSNDGTEAFDGLGCCFGDLDDRFYELLPEFDEPANTYAESHAPED